MSASQVLQADRVFVGTSAGGPPADKCWLEPGWVVISGGLVTGVGAGHRGDALDLGAITLAPGYVDVHVHGGGGAQVNGGSVGEVVESLEVLTRFHASRGTTSLLATTVSDTPERLMATVQGIANFAASGGVADGSRLAGVHLEGPWLARAKMGAQDPTSRRDPDSDELAAICQLAGQLIRVVTVAPELPGALGLIRQAVNLGVVAAIGHTDADFDTTVGAIAAGASHGTHLFNAMPPLHHRRPGPVAALLLDEQMTLEVVADLQHIHPAVLRLVSQCAPGRLVAVSDAIPAAGLESGDYKLGRLDVVLAGGRVTLASDEHTLAGSVLTMSEAVKNLVTAAGLTEGAALEAASSTPARAAHLTPVGTGQLVAGGPADMVLLDDDLSVRATVIGGYTVNDPQNQLAALRPA